MIFYINVNAFFCFIAGVIVSKDDLFVPLAIIGDTTGIVDKGLVSTLQNTAGSEKWISYNALPSPSLAWA